MESVSLFLLSHIGGKEKPTIEDVSALAGSVDMSFEEDVISSLSQAVAEKSVPELITEGSAMCGGGSVAAVSSTVEETKEEKAEEESSEEDVGLDSDMFD